MCILSWHELVFIRIVDIFIVCHVHRIEFPEIGWGWEAALSKIARAMNLRNSAMLLLSNARTRAFIIGVLREKSLSREARLKNRYVWIYRARKFRAWRNVRVIPDYFEQNDRYGPVLIVAWQTYCFSMRTVRRNETSDRREFLCFETGFTLRAPLLRHCENNSSLEPRSLRLVPALLKTIHFNASYESHMCSLKRILQNGRKEIFAGDH